MAYIYRVKGVYLLCKELENKEIPVPNGRVRWSVSSILSILKNEKYNGTLKQRKTVTTNYLSHKNKINYGEEAFITIENNHAPIITKEMFSKVQEELQRRRTATVERSRYSSRYPFSGKIECAYCNSKFERRKNSKNIDGRQMVWRCSEAVKYGKEKINAKGQKVGCNNKAAPEWFLKENFLAVLNTVIENKDLIVRELKEHVRKAIENSSNKSGEIAQVGTTIEKMATKKSRLIDLLVEGTITKADFEKTNSQYDKQLSVLNKQWAALKLDNKTVETLQQKLANIDVAVENLAGLKEFGDSICDEVLHKIVVDGRDKISYYLKTGKNADMFVKMPVLHTKYCFDT